MAGINNNSGKNSSGNSGGTPNGGPSDRTAVAQLVEQRIPNPQVAGSSPSRRVDDSDGTIHFGLYKYGQGYWVRVMTAVCMGMLVLSGALWASSQLKAVDLPISTWDMTIASPSGPAPAPGQSVTLLNIANPGPNDTPETIGTAVVRSYSAGEANGAMVIGNVSLAKGRVFSSARGIKTDAGFSGTIRAPIAQYVFNPLYLRSGAAIIILAIGSFFIYRIVGTKPNTVDFLVSVDGEMKKVNWSTRRVIRNSTLVVITATFMIAGILFLFDTVLSRFFIAIGVLEN